MHRLWFLAPLMLFVPAWLAVLAGGSWVWVVPLFTFGFIPLVETFFVGDTSNFDEASEARALADRYYDVVLYAVAPLQLGLVIALMWRLSVGSFAVWESLGAVVTVGIACGAYGINVAHELGHRRDAVAQGLSKLLLGTTLYMHFFVEHNRGHHRRVATPDDPASAVRGQTVYAFWWQSVTGGWRSAWALENARVERAGKPWYDTSNEMVRMTAIQALAVVAAGLVFGPLALAGWLVASVMGWLLLESVNYLEHYGLRRDKTERGTWERVRPMHSWNANRPLGRIFLFELTRHSDHHAHATRPFQVLRHMDDAPQLPAGYPTLILMSLVPPLFMRVMHPVLDTWTAQQERVAA